MRGERSATSAFDILSGQPVARYKSVISYDGTDYHGFQRQAEGIATIQAELEGALRELGWRQESILAAGRTDAGVHARGQVISFELAWNHDDADLTAALNDHLPAAIGVGATEQVDPEFHPRFDARRRRYRYSVIVCQFPDPLRERYAWRRWPQPGLASMQRAASHLLGRHDFGAFGAAPIEGGHTVRTVHQADWSRRDDRLEFDIEANAFLSHMVRRLAAACLEIGRDRSASDELLASLDRPDRRWQGRLAPPRGLCLEAVTYD